MNQNSYDFLKGFDSRMKVIGSISSFVIKLINSQRFKDRLEQSEMLNLSVAVLCYLLEKTLTKEGVTILEIRDFIYWTVNDCYGKDISKEECLELSRFLVRDVFMNGGEYYGLDVYNFEDRRFVHKNFQLLKDKIDSEGSLRYILSDLGNDFLIRTKEIDQHLHMSMQQIIAKEFIKRKDFMNANEVAKEMLMAVYSEKEQVESFIDRIRTSDILTVNIDEYKERLDGIFSVLESQKTEFEAIITLVDQSERDFLELGTYDRKVEELRIVKDTLNKVRHEHIVLLGMRFNVDEAYEEAIVNAMAVGLERRFDFNDTIMNPVRNNPELLESVTGLLRPLFKVDIPKSYNMFKAYQEQQMLKGETKEKVEGMDLKIDSDFIEEKRRLKEERHKKHLESLKIILDSCMNHEGEEIELINIINEMNISTRIRLIDEDEDKVFLKLTTFLFTGRTLYLNEMLSLEKKDDDSLTVPGLFKDLCEMDYRYRTILSLNVYKDFGTQDIEILGETEKLKRGKNYELERNYTITNYKFKVVCAK